jgi:hypothetical protein
MDANTEMDANTQAPSKVRRAISTPSAKVERAMVRILERLQRKLETLNAEVAETEATIVKFEAIVGGLGSSAS